MAAGQITTQSTPRKVPHHLPARIDRVDIGVESRTSRLPRARSSARLVAAVTLRSRSPTVTWNMFIKAISSSPPGPLADRLAIQTQSSPRAA